MTLQDPDTRAREAVATVAPELRPWRGRLAWLAILGLAAGLRIPALGVGLRHAPHTDEASFVGNVASMLAAGNLDHRYYEYPGLLFYLLAPVLAPFDGGPHAYLALRVFQAVFSLGSVVLTGVLAGRLAGPAAGYAAALLLAVAPLEARAAHLFRPDVTLQAFVLLAVLALRRVDGSARGDAAAGMAVGLATAVKFSGVLAASAYAVHRMLMRPFSWARMLLAAAVSVATFALLSPYTFLAGGRAVERARFQVVYHYVPRVEASETYLERLALYLRTFSEGLGWPTLVLALVGLVAARAAWRAWLPLLATVVVATGVYATAEVYHERFLIPFVGIVCAFAGMGFAALVPRHRIAAGAVLVVAIALPLARAATYVRAVRQPSVKDLVADWATAMLPEGTRIVTTIPGLGIDRQRFEVVEVKRWDSLAPMLSATGDVLIGAAEDVDDPQLPVARAFIPSWPHRDAPAVARHIPEGVRSRLRPVPLQPAWISSSVDAPVEPLVDGDVATLWSTPGPQKPGDRLEIRFPEPVRVARVELELGRRRRGHAQRLHLEASVDGETWQRVRFADGRPPIEEQRGDPSQVLVFRPDPPVKHLRLTQVGERQRPWAIAELRVFALDGQVPDLPGVRRVRRGRDARQPRSAGRD